MDKASALIGLLLTLVFIGPILYMIFVQATKDKKALKFLKSLGLRHSISLDHFELSSSLLLGLDSKTKKLLIVEPQNNMQYNLVDLHHVESSKISKVGHQEMTGKTRKETITHVSLELITNNPKEKVSEIVFYDEDDNSSFNPETQMMIAKRWEELIKLNLTA
jgi:hypothetical protein